MSSVALQYIRFYIFLWLYDPAVYICGETIFKPAIGKLCLVHWLEYDLCVRMVTIFIQLFFL